MTIVTPCSIRDYKENDYFVVDDKGHRFHRNVLRLVGDDGTMMPRFYNVTAGRYHYTNLNSVRHVGSTLTEAAKRGIAVGTKVIGIRSSHLFSRITPGDHLELVNDDDTTCPYFKNLTQGGQIIVAPLDNVVLPEHYEEPCKDETFEDAKDEEEDMTEEQTPAQKMGLKVGDKAVMIRREDGIPEGTVVTLVRDDDSDCPYFEYTDDRGRRRTDCPWLSNMKKQEATSAEKLLGASQEIPVGGPIENGDLIIMKTGDVEVADAPMSGPDGDDEYSVARGYVKVSAIASIIRLGSVEPFEEPKVEVTIRLDAKDAEKIRRSGTLLEAQEVSDNYSDEFRKAVASLGKLTSQALREQEEDEGEDGLW